MARVNISISDDLKESMEGLNCNWSAIAQTAFTHAVEIEILKNTGKEMEAGISRLRSEKQKNTDREDALGYIHGKNWALESASFDEIEKMINAFNLIKSSGETANAALYINKVLDSHSFDLEGLPKHDVSLNYALAFYESVAEIFSQI